MIVLIVGEEEAMQWQEELPEELNEEPVERNVHSLPTSYPCRMRLLTLAEEKRLCDQAQAGDEAACQEMMEANIRLVMAMARRYHGRSMTYEDLVQEGILGLLDAIKKYDGKKGYKFSTYATWWIRQAIVRSIEKQDRMIRLPTHGCNAERKITLAGQQIQDRLGRPATVSEIAAETGLSRTTVEAVFYCGAEPLSLDALMGEDADTPFAEMVPDVAAVDPEDNSLAQVAHDELTAAIASVLSEKERYVVERRFGFFDGIVWTLNDLAKMLSMSREGIRHVEGRAVKKLRLALRESPSFHQKVASSSYFS